MSERPLHLVEDEPEDDSPIRRHPHLVVIDTETGDHLERCPGCAERDAIIDKGTLENEGLIEQVRTTAAKIRELRRDKEKAMLESGLWPLALEAVEYWRTMTNRTKRSTLTPKRFDLLEPFLKKDGLAMVKLAIDGAAFDPHKADKPNRNGHLEVYDSIETIFKNRAAFERHVNRAPRERLREVKDSGGFGETATSTDIRIKAEVILALEGGYDLFGEEKRTAVTDAVERAKRELAGKGQATS